MLYNGIQKFKQLLELKKISKQNISQTQLLSQISFKLQKKNIVECAYKLVYLNVNSSQT